VDLLAQASAHYANHVYAEAETLADACANAPSATTLEVQQAYRLLILSFLKRDLIFEAQTATIKLLGVDFAYEPDHTQDPPVYVALVLAVKDQMRVAPTSSEAPVRAGGAPVDINTASAPALEALSGIGPVLAARIVAYREAYGPFGSVEDLEAVEGIGPRTVERLAPFVTVHASPLPASDPVHGPPALLPNHPTAPTTVSEAPSPDQRTLINVNTASAAELEALSGIGPVLAARIVAYREAYGPFGSVEDLEAVEGIGPRTVERLAPFVTVGTDPD
jgi:competence protein ComEA